MKHFHVLLAFSCFSEILGLTKDDSADLASILSHVTQLESGLHSTVTALQKTMDELEATKIQLNTTTLDLQATKAQLNTTTSDLQTTKVQLNTTTLDLQATKAQLNTTTSDLQATKAQLSKTASDLQFEKGYSAKERINLRNSLALKTKDVSFHVHLRYSEQTSSNHPVKFKVVLHNTGDSYNTVTGKFTAPVSGTYIFSAGVAMFGSKQSTYVHIVKSGSVVSSGYGETSTDIDDLTIPVTAITYVRQGSQVWVTTTDDVYLYGYTYGSTHFLGALLSVD